MRLQKAQRESLLTWIADGLESDEINKRAAKFKPKFKVSRQQVDHYRKTRKVDIAEVKKSGEFNALTSGLALSEKRVQLLQELAEKLRADLFENKRLWLDQVKGIGSMQNYERVEYQEFNAAEVAQLRGVLEDIALEVGERSKTMEHKGNVGLFDFDQWKEDRKKRLDNMKALEVE